MNYRCKPLTDLYHGHMELVHETCRAQTEPNKPKSESNEPTPSNLLIESRMLNYKLEQQTR